MQIWSSDPALTRLSLKNPIHLLALGFGSGLTAKAPGTFGTLAAVPFVMLMSELHSSWYIIITLVACIAGIYLCDKTARDMQVHDHGAIVWDEFAGLMITMFAAPSGFIWLVVGFLLFRVFDILKPWPIRWLDAKVHGGFGIMIDDILAGVFAWSCLQLLVGIFA